VDVSFPWTDHGWHGIPIKDYVIYELHVGTLSREGTFEDVVSRLDYLKNLGITALELMPVAQFPGDRNWGYDGVYPYATQNSYGGPDGLRRLVNACHERGLAVILDVVYNHLGPEGNYLQQFGPYFTERYRTPWGKALNFDGAYSDEVRRYFIENALYWLTDCHIDGLRLDSVDDILDLSVSHFLKELAEAVHTRERELGRAVNIIAESDRNDPRLVRPREVGGYGLDSQWSEGFHHSLHALLTGERNGYYEDFGDVSQMAKAYTDGFVHTGEYSPYRKRRHGGPAPDVPGHGFVVFAQNHDQIGNRMLGERLSTLVSFEALKLAAGLTLLSPFVPLLFMGEEYGETAPFLYFISHTDLDLVEAVRKGRTEEFAAFAWQGEPSDPQSEATFLRSKLNHALHCAGHHGSLFEFYREVIRLRKAVPALADLNKDRCTAIAYEEKRALYVKRSSEMGDAIMAFNFSGEEISIALPFPEGEWEKRLDSADARWQGHSLVADALHSTGEINLNLSPTSFVLFTRGESV
jgi:maltooligosyltrehalose trehalohydrolase